MHTAQEVRELIRKILSEQGSNIRKTLTETGYNNSLLLVMQRKGAMPSADKLGYIAEYLGVSVDYLLGRTEKPEVNE